MGILDYLEPHPFAEIIGRTLSTVPSAIPKFCADRGIDLEAKSEIAEGIEILQVYELLIMYAHEEDGE
jgi:hypothetical protein